MEILGPRTLCKLQSFDGPGGIKHPEIGGSLLVVQFIIDLAAQKWERSQSKMRRDLANSPLNCSARDSWVLPDRAMVGLKVVVPWWGFGQRGIFSIQDMELGDGQAMSLSRSTAARGGKGKLFSLTV